MKPIKSLVLVGVLAAIPTLAPTEASAQPGGYYGPGPGGPPPGLLPGGFHNRQGRLTFGVSGGLGYMNSDVFGDLNCNNCNGGTVSFGVAGHIGGFIGPRLALMFELQVNGQQLAQSDFFEDDIFLYQTAAMVAAQYWVTPQLWIKAGIGVAHLEEQTRDGFAGFSIDNGTAILGAVGYELFSSRFMSVDLQGRLLNGAYSGVDDNITAGTIGVGINWF
jgi:hypothetical protein